MCPADEESAMGMTPVDDVADDIVTIATNITKEKEENLISKEAGHSSCDVFHICSPSVTVRIHDLGIKCFVGLKSTHSELTKITGEYLRDYGFHLKFVPFQDWKEFLRSKSNPPT